MLHRGRFRVKHIRAKFFYWLLLCLLLRSNAVFAHQPGLGSLDVTFASGLMLVQATFALQDVEALVPMDSDLDAEVSEVERESAKSTIADWLSKQLLINVDGLNRVPATAGSVTYDERNNVHVEFRYEAVPRRLLLMQATFLSSLPEGHRQFVKIQDANGDTVLEQVLTRASDLVRLELAASHGGHERKLSSWQEVSGDFFRLGIEHIVTGYDHLLFLFALLAVTHGFWPALKIITAFTLAHSCTLALAALGWVSLPASFVEPFIAATIVYVAVENLIRGDRARGRYWLTFGFGLIHGFGFAGALGEMDISSGDSGILLPLLAFNLGIETGQIAVAAIVLPMIWRLHGKPGFSEKFLKGCSAMICLVGSYWFLARTVF